MQLLSPVLTGRRGALPLEAFINPAPSAYVRHFISTKGGNLRLTDTRLDGPE